MRKPPNERYLTPETTVFSILGLSPPFSARTPGKNNLSRTCGSRLERSVHDAHKGKEKNEKKLRGVGDDLHFKISTHMRSIPGSTQPDWTLMQEENVGLHCYI